MAAVGAARELAARAGGGDASLIGEALRKGGRPSELYGWPPSQLVPSVPGSGGVTTLTEQGRPMDRLRRRSWRGENGFCEEERMREKGHRTPRLGLREGASCLDAEGGN